LPDGRHVLFYASATSDDVAGLYVGSLDATEPKRLAGADTGAVYDSQSGHLLFGRQGTLLAQPFNPKTLTLAGGSFPIAERVQMAWFDRQGKQVEAVGPPGNYRGLDLAPDGTRVAAHRHDGNGGDIWVTDLSRSTTSRFTFDASQENSSPIWSPDGTRIVYGSIRNGKWGLYQKLANNAGTEEQLVESDASTLPVSWSPDGNVIVYEVLDPTTVSSDLWVVRLSGDRPSASSGRPEPAEGRKPSPLLHTPFSESHGQISPDGKWLAYYSNETGRTEVYVQPFPSGAGKWQISTSGGLLPRWRRDGQELFYMSQNGGGKMMAVSADGQRFLIPHSASSDTTNVTMAIAVVVNWAAGLKK
jgi:Tol biopolymer transport system component